MNWEALVGSMFASVVNALAVFLAVRYMSRVVERIEKRNGKKKDDHDR